MYALAISSRSPRSLISLAVFLLIVIGVGTLIGFSSMPDAWYARLAKPPFNPPNWVFAPAWFTLYVLIAVAGWRTYQRDRGSSAMLFWTLQMLLNWAWSPTWFTLHLLWPAFVIIVAILAAILAFIVSAWRAGDRISAGLFVPYALWVAFATSLNLSIAILN